MRIALSGAQSTGKSTLLKELQYDLDLAKHFSFRGNITRSINDLGIPINEKGSTLSQTMVLAKHIENAYTDNVILDRCILDGLVYTQYLYNHGRISKELYSITLEIFEQLLPRYDLICYIIPELPLADDGIRSIDREFYNEICIGFRAIITQYHIKVLEISGTVEQRVEQVKAGISARFINKL